MYSRAWFLGLPGFGSRAYFDLLTLLTVSGRMALLCKLAFAAALHVSIVDSKDSLRSFRSASRISRSWTPRTFLSRNMEFLQLSQKLQDLMSTVIAVKNCSNVSPCCWFQLLNIKLSYHSLASPTAKLSNCARISSTDLASVSVSNVNPFSKHHHRLCEVAMQPDNRPAVS